MPVGAVVRVDGIVVTKLPAHAHRDGLLADAQVYQAVHLVRPRQLADPLLEDADRPHRTEQLEAGVDRQPSRS